MPDVVICEPLRTPVGRFGGVFRDVAPEDLASTLITELVTRTGISGAEIDDVILGQLRRTVRLRRSDASRRSTRVWASMFPACRWIAGAGRDYRQSSRPSCRFSPVAVTWSSRAVPSR